MTQKAASRQSALDSRRLSEIDFTQKPNFLVQQKQSMCQRKVDS